MLYKPPSFAKRSDKPPHPWQREECYILLALGKVFNGRFVTAMCLGMLLTVEDLLHDH
jgi:hypothetical protein